MIDDRHGVDPSDTAVPSGAPIVAEFHSHPNDPHGGEFFSGEDEQRSDMLGLPDYLGEHSGAIVEYEPSAPGSATLRYKCFLDGNEPNCYAGF